jgi:tRNA G18 (ribose-2'-O)-methylase SpoU
VALGERVALLLGSEGHGLSATWLRSADERVHIPMSGDVDSLNVAAASAVACYAIRA